MANTSIKDMTSGSPARLIFGFFVPMVFGLLFQQLYNMVDTIIVGNYLVRGKEFHTAAQVRCQRSLAGDDICRSDDNCGMSAVPTDPDVDEYPGRYY